MRSLLKEANEDPDKGLETMSPTKYYEILAKSKSFIKMMKKYHPLCSLRFLTDPNHLDRKFERCFTMAVKQNKTKSVSLFPKNSIKTCYVSINQFDDFKSFAE